jgi:ABC-2 type transport system permease protein
LTAFRVFYASWLFNVRQLTASLFFVLTSTIQPVIFATIAFYMWRAGARPGSLLYVALGAGLMGIWSTTLFGAGGVIQWQRFGGTLELLIAAPPPFLLVLIGQTAAPATVGLYSIAATLVWGRVFFGVPLHIAHPLAFVCSIPATIAGLAAMGIVMASTFVLYRYGMAFSNLLEYPIWLITGLLVPVTLLPGWVEPIGWLFAPTWGVRAIRDAALGGNAWPAIGACLGLAVAYLALGAVTMANFERLARKRATLSLT